MGDFYEHIDDYKNGLLSGEALTLFEAQMKRDASLQIAVDNYNAAKSISEGLLEVDMMETLAHLSKDQSPQTNKPTQNHSQEKTDHSHTVMDHSKDNSSKNKTSIFNLRKLLAVASVMGVLLLTGWWMMKSNAEAERKEQIIAQLFEMRPTNPDQTKSINTEGMDEFQKGVYYFSLNTYEESIKWLKLAVEKENDKNRLSKGYFWLGYAYSLEGRFDDAREVWEKSGDERVEELIYMIDEKE